jgi:hypothetical protein
MIRHSVWLLAGILVVLLPCLEVPADEPLPPAAMATFRGSPFARELLRLITEDVKKGSADRPTEQRVRGVALVLAHHVGTHPENDPLPVRVAVQRAARDLVAASLSNDANRIDKAARRLQQGGQVLPFDRVLTAKEIRGDSELEDLHALFKLRQRGGFGYDGQPRSGIEIRLMNLARRPLTPAQLTAESDLLLRLVERTEAITEATDLFIPEKKQGQKDPKDWKHWNRHCLTACRELRNAIETRDLRGVRAAATKLTNGCNECHSVFRD